MRKATKKLSFLGTEFNDISDKFSYDGDWALLDNVNFRQEVGTLRITNRGYYNYEVSLDVSSGVDKDGNPFIFTRIIAFNLSFDEAKTRVKRILDGIYD